MNALNSTTDPCLQGSVTQHYLSKFQIHFGILIPSLKSGGALFNDVRRDDGGSAAITLQSLANKDYGAVKNRRRGVTARDVAGSTETARCDVVNSV